VTPRVQRYLHTLGAILASLAAIVLTLFRMSPAGEELMPKAAVFAAILLLLLGYVAYAYRRTKALLDEEAARSREETDRALERLRHSPVQGTEVNVRWRARTYVIFITVLVGAGAGAALAWSERSWHWLALSGLIFAWAAKALLARFLDPAVLRVGPVGIEDKFKFGLIPWQDIENVFLEEYKIKGTKVVNLSIGVRDPREYSRRLSPLARFSYRLDRLVSSDAIRLPVQTLDIAPVALFRYVRAFHERAVPAAAFSGTDNYYVADLELGKMKQAMAELDKRLAGPAPASGLPGAQAEELMARMDALLKADRKRISSAQATVERTNWVVIIAVVVGLLLALLVGAGVFGR
jgi:cbb3-type cytochrome oxidase subunit 3